MRAASNGLRIPEKSDAIPQQRRAAATIPAPLPASWRCSVPPRAKSAYETNAGSIGSATGLTRNETASSGHAHAKRGTVLAGSRVPSSSISSAASANPQHTESIWPHRVESIQATGLKSHTIAAVSAKRGATQRAIPHTSHALTTSITIGGNLSIARKSSPPGSGR